MVTPVLLTLNFSLPIIILYITNERRVIIMNKKLIVIAAILLLSLGFSSKGVARVSINIGIPLPPPFVFSAPPPVVVIPGTNVYFCPDLEADIFFYGGNWYRPYEGRWYYASSYNGPWVVADISRVPRVLVSLPPGAWRVPPGYHRIPHAQFRENWRRWEHERHWDGDRDWRAGWHGRPEGRGDEGGERGGGHEGHGGHEGRRG